MFDHYTHTGRYSNIHHYKPLLIMLLDALSRSLPITNDHIWTPFISWTMVIFAIHHYLSYHQ